MAVETNVVRTASEHLSRGSEGSEEFVGQVAGWSESIDKAALTGLLPTAIALMVFIEMAMAISEDRAPRVGWMLWRMLGASALLWGFGHIVALLTGLIGGVSDWPTIGDLSAPIEKGLTRKMKTELHLDNVHYFVVWLWMFIIDCLCALFAIIAVTVLSKMQALLLVILVATGKTCIIISIIPGVGIGKSWAKAVATVAAWGAMSGVIYGAVGMANISWRMTAASTLSAHMLVWTAYCLMGIFTLAIPSIVGMVMSGAASRAPGVTAALGAAMLGAKFVASPRGGALGEVKSAAGRGAQGAKASGRAAKWGAEKLHNGRQRLGKMARRGGATGKGGIEGAPKPGEAVNGIKSTRKRAPQVNGSEAPKTGGNRAINREKGAPDWHNRPEWSQSKEQWKNQGWSDSYDKDGNSLISSAKPKAREGHTPHLIQSGFNAQGNPQKFRWEQVLNEKAGDKFPWRGDDWGNKAEWKSGSSTKAGVQAPKAGEAPSPRKAPRSKNAVAKTGNTNAGTHVARGDDVRVQQQKVLPTDARRAEQAKSKTKSKVSSGMLGNSGLEKDSDNTKAKTKSRPRRGGKQER